MGWGENRIERTAGITSYATTSEIYENKFKKSMTNFYTNLTVINVKRKNLKGKIIHGSDLVLNRLLQYCFFLWLPDHIFDNLIDDPALKLTACLNQRLSMIVEKLWCQRVPTKRQPMQSDQQQRKILTREIGKTSLHKTDQGESVNWSVSAVINIFEEQGSHDAKTR